MQAEGRLEETTSTLATAALTAPAGDPAAEAAADPAGYTATEALLEVAQGPPKPPRAPSGRFRCERPGLWSCSPGKVLEPADVNSRSYLRAFPLPKKFITEDAELSRLANNSRIRVQVKVPASAAEQAEAALAGKSLLAAAAAAPAATVCEQHELMQWQSLQTSMYANIIFKHPRRQQAGATDMKPAHGCNGVELVDLNKQLDGFAWWTYCKVEAVAAQVSFSGYPAGKRRVIMCSKAPVVTDRPGLRHEIYGCHLEAE